MEDVIVIQHKPFDLQICVKKILTDEETLFHTELLVPCGTTTGWAINVKLGKVQCAEFEDREHIVLNA